ncbi:MAG: acetoin utilization protein AcuC [Pseudomonadota bacterium]
MFRVDPDSFKQPAPAIDQLPSALDRPRLISHDIYRHSRYGPKHPLSIPRVSTAVDLIRALGWLPDDQFVEGRIATDDELVWFHDPDYLAALKRVQTTQHATDDDRHRYNLGRMENPVFPEMFDRPATACGSSIMAAQMLRDGGVVHHVAGGTHHGRKARASGFCYLNDPVFAILALCRQGLSKIAYVDLDAHHGDGVQDAFHDDHRVFTISLHEQGRWPQTGALDDRAGGLARNIPLPKKLHDAEFTHVVTQAVIPLLQAWQPEALVIQGGCDTLADDPMSGLALTNNSYWQAIASLLPLSPRILMLGGGGYNPWTLARAWAGVWGVIMKCEMPSILPPAAEDILRQVSWQHRLAKNAPAHWFTTLVDPASEERPIRDEIKYAVEQTLAS